MPSDAVERALLGLADLAGCETTTEDRDGFYTEVWISGGKAFFAYLKAETRDPLELADHALDLILLTAEDVAEDPAPDVDAMPTEDQFVSFMENLKAYADGWLANDLDPRDGSIRFYID
jgi:hypothetical protein